MELFRISYLNHHKILASKSFQLKLLITYFFPGLSNVTTLHQLNFLIFSKHSLLTISNTPSILKCFGFMIHLVDIKDMIFTDLLNHWCGEPSNIFEAIFQVKLVEDDETKNFGLLSNDKILLNTLHFSWEDTFLHEKMEKVKSLQVQKKNRKRKTSKGKHLLISQPSSSVSFLWVFSLFWPSL